MSDITFKMQQSEPQILAELQARYRLPLPPFEVVPDQPTALAEIECDGQQLPDSRIIIERVTGLDSQPITSNQSSVEIGRNEGNQNRERSGFFQIVYKFFRSVAHAFFLRG